MIPLGCLRYQQDTLKLLKVVGLPKDTLQLPQYPQDILKLTYSCFCYPQYTLKLPEIPQRNPQLIQKCLLFNRHLCNLLLKSLTDPL